MFTSFAYSNRECEVEGVQPHGIDREFYMIIFSPTGNQSVCMNGVNGYHIWLLYLFTGMPNGKVHYGIEGINSSKSPYEKNTYEYCGKSGRIFIIFEMMDVREML